MLLLSFLRTHLLKQKEIGDEQPKETNTFVQLLKEKNTPREKDTVFETAAQETVFETAVCVCVFFLSWEWAFSLSGENFVVWRIL